MDTVDPKQRSKIMARIKSRDTNPELIVRRLLHSRGYRYRLHVKTLPGKPDLVFASRKSILFVHGCFWHLHEGCREGRTPSTNQAYWTPKLQKNVERDDDNVKSLEASGWRVMTIWECELANIHQLEVRIRQFLGSPGIHKCPPTTNLIPAAC